MKYTHINVARKAIAIAVASVISQWVLAQSPQIKVDLNMSGRPEPEVNEPGYLPWAIETANSVNKTFSGVKVTFSKQSSNGTALRATWFKAGVQAPHLAMLANDGIYVDGGDAGAAILMRLEGLPVGQHTLLVYLNSIVDPTKSTIAPIDISLDGKQIVDNFKPSVRVTNNADAASAYLTFTTTTGKADFLFKADTGTGASNKNVVINAFELNTPNIIDQSSTPVPERGDLHIDAPDGKFTLGWRAAASATRHHVYFGTKESDVANATQTSAAYKGARTTTSYPVSNLNTSTTYYWRIDEEKAGGVITKGTVWSFRPRLLAYPGAEGYGRFAIGGRGGKVVKVTNLNDDGAGSLRHAVENDIGPRTIVFDVSGIITLNGRLTLNSNFVTVAGQTAPGKGVVVRGAPFGTSGVSDVIFQNMRIRVGGGITFDGTGMAGANHSIMDHCSISWSMDEAFSSRGGKNITLQRTMLSEALNVAGHQNYPAGTAHGYAGTISGLTGSFHHNLLAHNEGRNFSMGSAIDGANIFASRLDIFNNVVYNWGGRATDGQVHKANFVNNYYKKGAATSLNYAFTMDMENYGIGTMQAYYAGNILQNTNGSFQCDGKDNSCGRRYRLLNGNPEPTWNVFPSSPLFPSYATIQTAKQAFKTVLSDVGTNQPVLDTHDTRIVNETLNGTYTYKGSKSGKPGLPDHQNDVGGYESYPTTYRANDWDSDNDGLPNWWETWYRLNPNSAGNNFSDANNDDDRDGYTQLEKYLQWKSNLHYNIAHNQTASINLRDAFRGYTLSPRYAATDIVNGKVTINGNTAVFTPNGCGLASFNIQVTDSEGDSMTRPVGVFTESANPGMCVGTNEEPGTSSSSSSSSSSKPHSSSLAAVSSSSSSVPVLSSSSLPSSSVASSAKSSSSIPSSSLPSSSSSSLIASSKSSSSIASSTAANNCTYVVSDDWGSGFVAAIRIKNNRTTAINNWSVNWTYSDGSKVTNSWNANVTGSNPYNATNMSYNGSIQPGQTIEFGFQGTKNSGAAVIPIISGSACN